MIRQNTPRRNLFRSRLATAAAVAGVGFAALALLPGCTPDAYRKSADRQVQALIRDRQEKTTGYTSRVDVDPVTDPRPTKKAYETIPLTKRPVGLDVPPPLEPEVVNVPFGALGPSVDELAPAPTTTQPVAPTDRVELFGSAAAERRVYETLRYGPPSDTGSKLYFELFDCLKYSVRNSRDYRTRMEDLYLAALDVTLERHLFEPRPFATVEGRYTGGQLDANYDQALTIANTVGVRQRLPYGGEIVARALVDFVSALNGNVQDGESAQLALSASIPLLRGAGLVNLESLINAERQLIYETRSFEDYRRTFSVDLSTRYFRLITSQQRIRNRYLNYLSFRDLTQRTAALFAAGRINALEVQRALQSLLSAEDSLNSAQQSYEADLDTFKLFIGMPVEQELDIVPLDVVVNAPDVDQKLANDWALQYRLDLQTARDQLDDARRGVSNAKNGLLPDLDLNLEGNVRNDDPNAARDIDSRTARYSGSITLDLPVDRLAERNTYRRSLITLERRQRNLEQTQDEVIADVRRAIRGVRSAQLSLQIQQRNIEVAQQRLEYSNEMLLSGRSTDSRNVVEAQNSLLSAQDTFDQRRADLQVALLQFLRDTGLLRVDEQAGSLGTAMRRTDASEPVVSEIRRNGL